MTACACAAPMVVRLVDTRDVPPRRAAVVRCSACDAVLERLTPRMVAVLAAANGRIVRPQCGATARVLRERGILVLGSVLLSDRGMAIAELVRVGLQTARENASATEVDHGW